MRVSSLSMVILNCGQKQEKCFNRCRLAFTSETGQPSELNSGGNYNMPNIEKNNYFINGKWTASLDNAFVTGGTEAFLADVEKSKLKSIFKNKDNNSIRTTSSVENPNNANIPLKSTTVKCNDLSVIVDKSAHIQINYGPNGEHLFLEASDLAPHVTMDDVGKSIITGGVRFLDPFDQNDWAKTGAKTGWPTAADTRVPEGVANLKFANNRGIFINTADTVGQAYGVHPRGLVLNEGNSVIFAFQQDVLNPDIKFGAWSVLPFRVREGKQAFAVFPVQDEIATRYGDLDAKEFDEARESGKWSVFGDKRKFFMVDASKAANKKSDFMGKGTDWSMFATEGDDHVWVIRSSFNENDIDKIFKIYSEGKKGGGKNYIELEAIASRVAAGQKSTLVYRLDKVSLKDLGLSKVPKRLTKTNMKEVLQQAAYFIENNMVNLRRAA